MPTSRTQSHNETQDLLLLQDYVCKLSHTERTLEDTYVLLQQTELLAGVINEQDCRAIRTACCCLKSLRIRVEARANVTERAVIGRQLQLMQASVQHYLQRTSTQLTQVARPGPRLNTSNRPSPCPENERSHPCTNVAEPATWSTDRIEYNWLQRMHLLTDSLCTATLMLVHGTSAEHSVKLTTPAEGAPRLQACINAVELAIIANSIALDTVLKAACTARVPYSPPMMMMLGKELLSGLWVRPECRSYCCHFSHRSCLTSCFTFYSFFTTLVATRRCRCLLRSARVNVMPERLLGCSLWSRGSWLGGSLVSALSFVASITLLPGPFVWFRVFFVLLLVRWPFS